MTTRQTLPMLWLISDARNDAVLDAALARLPRGSGFVFRHYHLSPGARRRRFEALNRIAKARGHVVALSAEARMARTWGAQAVYGAPEQVAGAASLRIATVHSLSELGTAHRAGADMVMLSPVFATRSHPGAAPLGPVRARLIARHALVPVVMLGGMTPQHARRMWEYGWAAIDGLTPRPPIPTAPAALD